MNKEKTVAAFISIPKCASKSILTSFELGNCRDWHGNAVTETHVLYENHQRIYVLEDLYDLNNIYLFCFVRNPYQRIVSWYQYHIEHSFYKYVTLNDWVKNGCPIHWKIQNKTDWEKEKLSPLLQYNFIESKKGIKVDFIGKMENFKEDCDKLINILNQKFKERGFKKIIPNNIIHKNKSIPIKEELTVESKEIIYNLFKKDFEYFDYAK